MTWNTSINRIGFIFIPWFCFFYWISVVSLPSLPRHSLPLNHCHNQMKLTRMYYNDCHVMLLQGIHLLLRESFPGHLFVPPRNRWINPLSQLSVLTVPAKVWLMFLQTCQRISPICKYLCMILTMIDQPALIAFNHVSLLMIRSVLRENSMRNEPLFQVILCLAYKCLVCRLFSRLERKVNVREDFLFFSQQHFHWWLSTVVIDCIIIAFLSRCEWVQLTPWAVLLHIPCINFSLNRNQIDCWPLLQWLVFCFTRKEELNRLSFTCKDSPLLLRISCNCRHLYAWPPFV